MASKRNECKKCGGGEGVVVCVEDFLRIFCIFES